MNLITRFSFICTHHCSLLIFCLPLPPPHILLLSCHKHLDLDSVQLKMCDICPSSTLSSFAYFMLTFFSTLFYFCIFISMCACVWVHVYGCAQMHAHTHSHTHTHTLSPCEGNYVMLVYPGSTTSCLFIHQQVI